MDKVAAVEGDTVTITPLDTLATLTVTDEDSEEVVVTQDSNVYTFEMPASDVVIAATAAEPEPTTYIVTYDAGEDDNNPQATVTFKSPNPQSEAYLNGTGLDDISENWFNIVSDRLNYLIDAGEDAVISANSGELKLFFESEESTDNICLGTSPENVYVTITKEHDSVTDTDNIVSVPNTDNIPTSAINFVATFDNPWYIKTQIITLTDNEYAQYVQMETGPYPVGEEFSIMQTLDAPAGLTFTVVNDTTEESITLDESIDTDTNKTVYKFEMPDAPVTITAGIE